MRKALGLMLVQLLAMCTCVSAATPGEQFAQMLELLKITPKDDSLRENIVRLGKELKPAPAIPEAARRALVRGNTALEAATGPDDYVRAARNYEEAAGLAPWWGAAYLSLARVQDLQLDYRSAQRNVHIYMVAIASPEEARKAQDYLYELEYKQERADKTRSENDSKYGWASGQWSVTKKVFDINGNPVVQTDPVVTRSSIEGSRVMLNVAGDTKEHGYPGGYNDSPSRVDNSFRVSYDDSGQLVMEIFGPRDPYTCPTAYDWNQVKFDVSSDRRTITATREDLYAPPICKPTGNSTVWVFERAP